MMILVVLFAAVVCVLIVAAVLAFKAASALFVVLMSTLALLLVAAPLCAIFVLLTHFGQAPTPTAAAQRRRTYRLAVLAAVTAAFGFFDIVWITHSLHWSDAPLLAFLLIGGAAAGALALIHEPVEPWRETPVTGGDLP